MTAKYNKFQGDRNTPSPSHKVCENFKILRVLIFSQNLSFSKSSEFLFFKNFVPLDRFARALISPKIFLKIIWTNLWGLYLPGNVMETQYSNFYHR